MAKMATLEIDGKKYEFPIIEGTENELGIDIKNLRGDTTGVVTFDPGYKNTGACESAITFLDGEKGILRYRGYAIEELAEKAHFLEVCYLLIFGELPTEVQLNKFHTDIKAQSHVDEDVKRILDGFPKAAHPMGVLSSLTSALVAFNPSSVNVDSEEDMYKAIVKILGKFPVLTAWTYRKRMGLPLDYGGDSLGYVDNFLKMMFKKPSGDYTTNETILEALDKLLILHADHEQNCSTSTVRMALPLVTIGISLAVAQQLIAGLLELGMSISPQAMVLVSGMMLGAGTDYAVFLISRNRDFLVGQSVSPELRQRALADLLERPEIERLTFLHLEFVGPGRILLIAAVDLVGDDSESRLAERLHRLSDSIRDHDQVEEAIITLARPEDPSLKPHPPQKGH